MLPNNDHALRPQYDLYIRRTDQVFRLVERKSGRIMPIVAALETTTFGWGMHLTLQSGIGVYLMSDEIHVVDELPAGACEKNAS